MNALSLFKGPRLSSRVFCSLYFNDCIPGVSFNMFSCFLSFLQTVANARGLNTPIFIHVLHYSPLTLLGGPPRRPQPASRHFSQELVVVVVGQCVSGWIILGITGKFQTKACGKSQQNWVLKDIFLKLQFWTAARLLTAWQAEEASLRTKCWDPDWSFRPDTGFLQWALR